MPNESDRPIGQLFTEVYRDRGDALSDSRKFRVQLLALFKEAVPESQLFSLGNYMKMHKGINIWDYARSGTPEFAFNMFFDKAPLDDLLDSITLTSNFLKTTASRMMERWVNMVGYALVKQNMAYEVDDEGGVHHRVDAAFQLSKSLTLTCLSGQGYEAAHNELEKAFDYLTQVSPDTKMATVNIFLAAENVFKIVTGTGGNLDQGEVLAKLLPLVQKIYSAADNATKQSSAGIVQSFAKWVNSCHPYRHGQGDTSVIAPPSEIAITLVTSGADYIRWLVEVQKLKT